MLLKKKLPEPGGLDRRASDSRFHDLSPRPEASLHDDPLTLCGE